MNVRTFEGHSAVERCCIYARNAAGAQHEHTVDQQIAGCRTFAKQNGWLIVGYYVRFDARKSGTCIAGRTGLQELLALAEAEPRPFDILLCESVSRLSRNLTDIVWIEDSLRRRGIKIRFVEAELQASIFELTSTPDRLDHLMRRVVRTIAAGPADTLQPA